MQCATASRAAGPDLELPVMLLLGATRPFASPAGSIEAGRFSVILFNPDLRLADYLAPFLHFNVYPRSEVVGRVGHHLEAQVGQVALHVRQRDELDDLAMQNI